MAVSPLIPQIIHMVEVTSTQDAAADYVNALVAEGRHIPPLSAVTADYQTAGRGRLGRLWDAEPGQSLLLTAVLNVNAISPQAPRELYGWFPLIAARVMVQTLQERASEYGVGLDLGIKWPNDVLVGQKKLSGILASIMPAPLNTVILLGIGLNIGQRNPPGVGATSLGIELDKCGVGEHIGAYSPLREAVGERYLDLWTKTVHWLSRLLKENPAQVLPSVHRWVSEPLISLGRRVTAEFPDGSSVEAIAGRLDLDGALILNVVDKDTNKVQEKRITVGSIVHARQQTEKMDRREAGVRLFAAGR